MSEKRAVLWQVGSCKHDVLEAVDADADLRVSENATPTIATSDMRCSGVRAARAAGWRAFMFTRPSHVFV